MCIRDSRPERLLCGMCYWTEYRAYENRDYKPPSTINFSDLDILADHFAEASIESLYRDSCTRKFHNMVKNSNAMRTWKENLLTCNDGKQCTIESSFNAGDEAVVNICQYCGKDLFKQHGPRHISHIGVGVKEYIDALFEGCLLYTSDAADE